MNRFSSSFTFVVSRPLRRSVRRLSTSPLPSFDSDDFGFRRPEFGREKLAGTVQPYDRHVFLCSGSPNTWHPVVESPDGMPRLLLSAINTRTGQMSKKVASVFRSILGFQLITSDGILLYVEALKKPKFVLYSHVQTKLTICEGDDSGDVLIFPDMIKYRLDKQFTTK